MAKQTIGIGTVANDDTGDTLRNAMDKCNDNFTELYDDKVNTSSIVNNLTSGGTTVPLSAQQGVAIKALIDAIATVNELTDLDTTVTGSQLNGIKTKVDYLTVTGAISLDTVKTKTDYLTVTAATSLDTLRKAHTLQTLTDAPTVAFDASLGYNGTLLITANRTLGAFTNAPAGSSGKIWLTQDATGGRSLTLDASQIVVDGTAASIASMAANERALIEWATGNGTTFLMKIYVE